MSDDFAADISVALLPDRIIYGNGHEHHRRVDISWSSTGDWRYRYGQPRQLFRVDQVETWSGNTPVSRYFFNYETNTNQPERLAKLSACDAANTCLSPHKFNWPTRPEDHDAADTWTGPTQVLDIRLDPIVSIAGDINGDGFADLVVAQKVSDTTADIGYLPGPDYASYIPLETESLTDVGIRLRVFDVDVDGKDDLVIIPIAPRNEWFEGTVPRKLKAVYGGSIGAGWQTFGYEFYTPYNDFARYSELVDFDGDSKVDLLHCNPVSGDPETDQWVAIFDIHGALPVVQDLGISCSDASHKLWGDFDGDGVIELLARGSDCVDGSAGLECIADENCVGSCEAFYSETADGVVFEEVFRCSDACVSRGRHQGFDLLEHKGTFASGQTNLVPNWGPADPTEVPIDSPKVWKVVDLNGDGYDDLVTVYKFDSCDEVFAYINRGDGSWDIRQNVIPISSLVADPLACSRWDSRIADLLRASKVVD